MLHSTSLKRQQLINFKVVFLKVLNQLTDVFKETNFTLKKNNLALNFINFLWQHIFSFLMPWQHVFPQPDKSLNKTRQVSLMSRYFVAFFLVKGVKFPHLCNCPPLLVYYPLLYLFISLVYFKPVERSDKIYWTLSLKLCALLWVRSCW